MSKFNIGDRVRLVNEGGDPDSDAKVGDLGTVEAPTSLGLTRGLTRVRLDSGETTERFTERFEKVESGQPAGKFDGIKEGDRVRFTLEAVVQHVSRKGNNIEVGAGSDFDIPSWADLYADDVVSIEKVEPPVEVFKPGDRIRRKLVDGWDLPYEVTIGDGGYLHHSSGSVNWVKTSNEGAYELNSERFELVARDGQVFA